ISAARNRFGVDEVYGDLIVMPGKHLAMFSAYTLDARGVDGLVRGTGKLVGGLSEYLRRVQTGYVRNYAAAFLFGAVLLLAVVALRVGG
ncbi:MAG: NADH-quinone oxidoreductase subunit L, partial [Actinobacteria bacterium]|nr:NADH-quinone oxidoreductase subunit L [Actinomycetota bacterium]